MMIRQMTSVSRCSPSGLSCCHLTQNLLLFMPGVFVDTVEWFLAQFWAPLCRPPRVKSMVTEASCHFGKISAAPRRRLHHLTESSHMGGKHVQDDCCRVTDDAD